MRGFARALPAIRKRVHADLKTAPLSRAHVLATVVLLLEKTLIRIGNKEYARANKSFGLTTLLDQHVQIKGAHVRAIDSVAAKLGNTRAVCRSSYIHPGVFGGYRRGVTIAAARPGPRIAHLSMEEAAVLALHGRDTRRCPHPRSPIPNHFRCRVYFIGP